MSLGASLQLSGFSFARIDSLLAFLELVRLVRWLSLRRSVGGGLRDVFSTIAGNEVHIPDVKVAGDTRP